MASIFKRNGKGNYVVQFTDHLGIRREKSSRTTDKRMAQQLAAKLDGDSMLRREGIVDVAAETIAEQARSPITNNLAKFETKMRAEGCSEKHVLDTKRIIERILKEQSLSTLGQINSQTINQFSEKLKAQGHSTRSIAAYLSAMKSFTRWMHREGKLATDPLIGVRKPNPKVGRRLERRMLLPEEFAWLNMIAAKQPTMLGLTGSERLLLYTTAIQTGLRVGELRSLKRGGLYLTSKQPFILAKAGTTKNGKPAHQYIKPELATALNLYIETRPPQAPVFSIPEGEMAKLLRSDLAAARKAWLDQAGQDRKLQARREASDFLLTRNHSGEVLDFHALRHTCGAWAALGGAHPKAVQTLMRHSAITLTMDTYGHLFPGQDAETVHRLPDMTLAPVDLHPLANQQEAAPNVLPNRQPEPQHLPQHSGCCALPSIAMDSDSLRNDPDEGDAEKAYENGEICEPEQAGGSQIENAPLRTRTFDPLIKSQLLYQLS